MARKKITDDDGYEIVKCLEKNQVLERLELEGNQLGPKTAGEVATLI